MSGEEVPLHAPQLEIAFQARPRTETLWSAARVESVVLQGCQVVDFAGLDFCLALEERPETEEAYNHLGGVALEKMAHGVNELLGQSADCRRDRAGGFAYMKAERQGDSHLARRAYRQVVQYEWKPVYRGHLMAKEHLDLEEWLARSHQRCHKFALAAILKAVAEAPVVTDFDAVNCRDDCWGTFSWVWLAMATASHRASALHDILDQKA